MQIQESGPTGIAVGNKSCFISPIKKKCGMKQTSFAQVYAHFHLDYKLK
jgi:hypothetical protein